MENSSLPAKSGGSKTVLWVIIVLLLIAGLWGYRLYSGFNEVFGAMPKAADELFGKVAAGNTQEAYSSTSKEFQDTVSAEDFKVVIDTLDLTQYSDAEWNDRYVSEWNSNKKLMENTTGTIKGVVALKDGGKIPLEVNFIFQNKEWKVYGIHTQDFPEPGPLPDESEVKILVKNSMTGLAKGMESNDINGFHNSFSDLYKMRVPLNTFVTKLGSYKMPIPVTKLESTTPVLTTKPKIGEDNLLYAVGYYPNGKTQLRFELGYVYENGAWKLQILNLK